MRPSTLTTHKTHTTPTHHHTHHKSMHNQQGQPATGLMHNSAQNKRSTKCSQKLQKQKHPPHNRAANADARVHYTILKQHPPPHRHPHPHQERFTRRRHATATQKQPPPTPHNKGGAACCLRHPTVCRPHPHQPPTRTSRRGTESSAFHPKSPVTTNEPRGNHNFSNCTP